MDTRIDLLQQLLLRGMKTLRISTSIYNLASGTATAGWISIDG
jgi:hypothetical protein